MDKYVKRATELLQNNYDQPLNVLNILEDDKFVLVTLATKDLIDNNAGMECPYFALNKENGREHYGTGIGWIYDPEFVDMKPNTMNKINILETAS